MVVAASSGIRAEELDGLGIRLQGWAGGRFVAGVTDRRADPAGWVSRFRAKANVQAEQVHGASIAVIAKADDVTVAGCDALLTHVPGVALRIRTADCLPIFFADPVRHAIGLAHAGWRGLAASLPARMVAAMRDVFGSTPEALHVAIGPSIRPCCYEVGLELVSRFGAFVQDAQGRRTCDLIGSAIKQLQASGVRGERIFDMRRCTGCETNDWFSLRREGPETGRLVSFLMIQG